MEIRADYTDEQNYLHIDVWQTDDDNEEGRTIAIVCLDTCKVFFIDNTMRNDYWVKETISSILSDLQKEKANTITK
jgi:phosphopentomutase